MKQRAILSVFLFVAASAAACDEPMQSYIELRDNPDVYTADLPKFEGGQHSDGWAEVHLEGIAVETVGGREHPVPDVRFSVEPDDSFAHLNNCRVIFLSNRDGEFLAQLFVGAAMTAGGSKPGTVYQTIRAKLRIEKPGYRTRYLLFDYKMPPVKVFMQREDTKEN